LKPWSNPARGRRIYARKCPPRNGTAWEWKRITDPKFAAQVVDIEVISDHAQPSSKYLADLMGKKYDKVVCVQRHYLLPLW
jgi:hypothetical protein